MTAGERVVRTLTTIHGLGSLVLIGMTVYVLSDSQHTHALARTPGSRLMVRLMGRWLPAFLGGLAVFLGAMAWGSLRRRPWAWHAAVAAYTIGVIGSLWEVSIGIGQAWVSALINAGVVVLLSRRSTRDVYLSGRLSPTQIGERAPASSRGRHDRRRLG